MSKTILITGSSTGIGRATAFKFQQEGWNVIATMRTPEKEEELTRLDNVLVTRLDVLDLESIDTTLAAGIERFGKLETESANIPSLIMMSTKPCTSLKKKEPPLRRSWRKSSRSIA